MSDSPRLRLRDVRRLFHLIGETLELGDDPAAWRPHFLTGLCKLIGDGRGAWLGVDNPSIPPAESDFSAVVPIWDAGWDDSQEHRAFRDSINATERDPNCNPMIRPLVARLSRDSPLVTVLREEVLSDQQWYSSTFYEEFAVPTRNGTFANSVAVLPANGAISSLVISRRAENRPVGPRERQLLHLAHAEIAPLIGTRLAIPGQVSREGMTSRQREVLDYLLDGFSERQIAELLHRSACTIHEHILSIYRHFGVGTRAELMARWIRRVGR